MKKAIKSDENKVIRIICESFNTNPHINFIIKNDEKRDARMRTMARYAFRMGLRRDAVHLTDDGLGVAIIYEYGKVSMNLREYILQLGLGINAFTLRRSYMVNSLETLIRKNRASDVDFLYLWFFGVADEALGTSDGRDLMKHIFSMSADQKLPIYLETSIRRNNIIYKRFGFEDYNMLETGKDGLTFWYMKRPFDHEL